jgi:hypothetical protein
VRLFRVTRPGGNAHHSVEYDGHEGSGRLNLFLA